MFGNIRRNALSLHLQSENETYSERQRGSLKSSFEKIFRKIWKGCENELSLHHFPLWKSLKTFEVFFEKDLESPKKGFTFATAFRFEKWSRDEREKF